MSTSVAAPTCCSAPASRAASDQQQLHAVGQELGLETHLRVVVLVDVQQPVHVDRQVFLGQHAADQLGRRG